MKKSFILLIVLCSFSHIVFGVTIIEPPAEPEPAKQLEFVKVGHKKLSGTSRIHFEAGGGYYYKIISLNGTFGDKPDCKVEINHVSTKHTVQYKTSLVDGTLQLPLWFSSQGGGISLIASSDLGPNCMCLVTYAIYRAK